MGSVNKVYLVGNVGNIDSKEVGDSLVCQLSVATSENWTDKSGQKQERTEWSKVVVWGKQAHTCVEYLEKGSLVAVEGSLQTREYEKDGVTRKVTEIKGHRVTFLGGRKSKELGSERGGRGDLAEDDYQGRAKRFVSKSSPHAYDY